MSYLYTSERSQMYNRPLFLERVAGIPSGEPNSLTFQAKGEARIQNPPGFAQTVLNLSIKGVPYPKLTLPTSLIF